MTSLFPRAASLRPICSNLHLADEVSRIAVTYKISLPEAMPNGTTRGHRDAA